MASCSIYTIFNVMVLCFLGMDRFCLGIAKLLTPGGIGVWWIVVFLLLTRNVNQTVATPGNNFTDSLHCAFTRFLCVHYLVHGYPYTVYKLQKRREREKTMYG